MSETSASPEAGGGRLLSSLQGLSATLVAIFHTRLELLATEVEEEKRRMLAVLGWGAVAILMGTVACVFLAGFVTVLFWERYPLLVLGVLTLFFAVVCMLAVRRIAALLHASEGMLAASLAELVADRDALAKAAAARGHGGEAGVMPSPSSLPSSTLNRPSA